jgi:hypothetical protein
MMKPYYNITIEDSAGNIHGLFIEDLSIIDHEINIFMDGQPHKILSTSYVENND